jgi:G3E family GTPase
MRKKAITKMIVHLICGFLGAGKTTLLRRILESDEDLSETAVIVNEFGSVGIDGTAIADGNVEVIELVNGCICCSLALDLASTLTSLSQRTWIRRVFIEATGIAEPHSISEVLENNFLESRLERGVTVGVLDGRMWKTRHHLGQFFLNQLREVDIVILNKMDLVGDQGVAGIQKQITEEIGPVRVIPASFCDVDLDEVFRVSDEKPENGTTTASLAETNFTHYAYRTEHILSRQCIEAALGALTWEVYRAKGPVRFEKETLLLNYAGGRVSWESWPRRDPTCIVFVGRCIDTGGVKRSLDACAFDQL